MLLGWLCACVSVGVGVCGVWVWVWVGGWVWMGVGGWGWGVGVCARAGSRQGGAAAAARSIRQQLAAGRAHAHSGAAARRVARRFALPRPEGQRCLLVSARGRTAARLRSGVLLERFESALPGGGRGSAPGDAFCILDCVYHAADRTYYVAGAFISAACQTVCTTPQAAPAMWRVRFLAAWGCGT
jgi:hypothetical protein